MSQRSSAWAQAEGRAEALPARMSYLPRHSTVPVRTVCQTKAHSNEASAHGASKAPNSLKPWLHVVAGAPQRRHTQQLRWEQAAAMCHLDKARALLT